ncbi:virulence RhuM family protein [Staphylococcus delphini]|uniref:virulence RhuM family protein n=1 Tax=Staphylococcus delphini TaxID=53344 RepID=UPI0023B23C8C|nr:virulence RhuM family protein [Staphylococcus delphini]MDE9751688.1 virulence RhuM family protein [Staphylococcus delphini]MDE9788965.1 virulence RhuM family protein [Staphylococcus delphini]MDE9791402.1 virulence RhuM family protein [Staphylococcus delphini]MDE9793732.1 virulence RhuM family protein [Staphylococcus delphini]MDE9795918.1 virulence RhuM family protein [Staphylococcus delphini]
MSSNFLMYQTEDGQTKIELRLEDETVWMTQKSLADLYQKSIKTISEHIKHIYDEGELTKEATIRKNQIVQTEGDREVTRESNFYNLEVIIAVGYRVRSHRGTQFRQWATDKINEYLVKGFVMDDARLKEMRNIGSDYFDELLERIRDIRASEKRFYIKITDIYATSVDYDPQAEITRTFFATVQNKLHYAIHGMTAAELIQSRADATQNNMGLQSFKGEKDRKNDVTIAKNYLTEKELKSLNRIVTMYLDYAEDQAERQQPMYMSDWIEKLDAFLQFNDRELLHNPGKVSKQVADSLAHSEYLNYNHARNRMNSHSDFLDFIKENDVKYFSDSD